MAFKICSTVSVCEDEVHTTLSGIREKLSVRLDGFDNSPMDNSYVRSEKQLGNKNLWSITVLLKLSDVAYREIFFNVTGTG